MSAFCQIDQILPFVLAETIKHDLQLSDTQLGLLTGIAFAVCYSLTSLPLARVTDRGSPRLVLVSSMLIWSVMTALGGLAGSFVSLAITRFGVAFGESSAVPAGHALIARKVSPKARGLAIGLFTMGTPIGAMVGFVAGGRLGDAFGWRATFLGAGVAGSVIALLVGALVGKTPAPKKKSTTAEPFLQSSIKLLFSPRFRWLFLGAVAVGFTSAPFYAFCTPFLIRTHGYSATQAGLIFGLPQGLMGIFGTLLGGRGFDRALSAGRRGLLQQPAVLFLMASVTTFVGLLAPAGWIAVLLFTPLMLSFPFLLPWAFRVSHLVAGPGKQAVASSLVLIGASLLGPALAPLLVGAISDSVTAAHISNGLRWALLTVPAGSFLTGLTLLAANRRLLNFDGFANEF
jgi:predicted MFS family arabinose efflux permease